MPQLTQRDKGNFMKNRETLTDTLSLPHCIWGDGERVVERKYTLEAHTALNARSTT